MGDYSRNPDDQLDTALSRQYVAVRMQQGVPVLDADLNELDGLRRAELEAVGTWSIGSGTPVGSNAFAIVPIAGGGIGTIVLRSNSPTVGTSTVEVDVGTSSAAAALGFTNANSAAARIGSMPAIITGHLAEPFILADGATLVVQANDQAAQTITFAAGDFADITNATAAEVVAAITAAAPTVIAAEGIGNDFIIKAGGGTSGAVGRIMVDGQMTVIEADTKFSEQPLFNNNALAAAWGVDVIPLLTAPATEAQVVYLDVWNREVASSEHEDLVDPRIGMETAIRLRREWAVRVVREPDYANTLANIPAGHTFYRIALLQRQAGNNAIDGAMIADERVRDLSLRREIFFSGVGDIPLVDTQDFVNLLTQTRDVVRDFIAFLTFDFIKHDEQFLAGEVAGIDALSAIANIADHGLALLQTKSMGTQDALSFFRQIQAAEERFLTVWTGSVLPIVKTAGQNYDNSFGVMVNRIGLFLTGPAPGTFQTIPDALDAGDLDQAVRSQLRIVDEFAGELNRPVGFLTLAYFGSTTAQVVRNQSFDLVYELAGTLTPADDIDINVSIDPQWPITLRNGDSSVPFDLAFGPGDDDRKFIVSVRAPDVTNATTPISLEAFARTNPAGVRIVSTQKTLTIGDPLPPSEEALTIRHFPMILDDIGGVYQFPASRPFSNARFRLENNAAASVTVDVTFEPTAPPGNWVISPPSGLTNIVIPAGTVSSDLQFTIIRDSTVGSTLTFTLSATETGTTNLLGVSQISFISVA